MTAPLDDAKARLRQEIRERVGAMTSKQREAASHGICSRLQEQTVWRSAGSILFFAPMEHEPDVWPLLKRAIGESRQVSLPHFNAANGHYEARQIRDPEAEIVIGKYGIREPAIASPVAPLNRLDLILVPGIGFDLHGRRLGRGRGYYDRLLADVRGMRCGVAFDEQVVSDIPTEPHDAFVNCILTPTRWIEL
jgi:5-formyltetrahydrofolate cyclo-ligase